MKDYCAENCQAINGGTVSKHVFTWFWVRSNLPKIVWKKCMDYKLKRSNGKFSWYKIVGGSVVPVRVLYFLYSFILVLITAILAPSDCNGNIY